MREQVEKCSGCGTEYRVPKPPRLVTCGECETFLFSFPVVEAWLKEHRETLDVKDRAPLLEIVERNPDLALALAIALTRGGIGSVETADQSGGVTAHEAGDQNLDSRREFPEELSEIPFEPMHGKLTCMEFRNVLDSSGESWQLTVETVIVGVVRAAERTTTFGVKLEGKSTKGETTISEEIFFDELQEAIDAFDVIAATGSNIANQPQEYTEVHYETDRGVRYGFSQTQYGQSPFLRLPDAPMIYLSIEQFFELRDSLEEGQERLRARGAKVQAPIAAAEV